jgi:hypothetical protein
MQEFLSKKQIIKISDYWNPKSKQYTINDWWWRGTGYYCVAKDKLENPNWAMQIPTVKTLPDNAKLVFHSTSKFPRHKLGLTTFKRKIKEKGADFIVGNFKPIPHTSITTYTHAYETETKIYVTQLTTIDLNIFGVEYGIDLSTAKHYTDYEMITAEKEHLFYLDYITGKHSLPIISDDDLNKIIDGNQERLSVTELSTIVEMVKSRDKENVNLALKLFAQFNLSADPTFSWLFLSIFSRNFSGISSVLYTNLKNQFTPIKNGWYYYILEGLKHRTPIDDHETELISYLLKDYLVVQNLSVKTFMEFRNLGYDIELENNEQDNSY